jgi:hypothetical protein
MNATPTQPDRSWMRESRWGVFLHFLADAASTHEQAELSTDEWNRRVDAVDVARLAEQLDETGVRVFGITLGQNSGFFCAPNLEYDALVGRRPSRLSQRDLIADLIDALRPFGIRLIAYCPSHAPAHDRLAVERLACHPTWDASLWSFKPDLFGEAFADRNDARLAAFQGHWERILREWSLRWGRGVSAWWIDGVYFAEQMYQNAESPNFASFRAALRSGNPDALLTFNEGIRRPLLQSMPASERDYLSGEADFCLPVGGRWYSGDPIWRDGLVDDEQLFVFTFLGRFWGEGPPRFPDDLVRGYTRHINDAGGFLLWDVPYRADGTLDDSVLRQLRSIEE